MSKSRIVLLATGGTIAGKDIDSLSTNGYKPGEIYVNDILSSIPGLDELADIIGIQVCNIASDDITQEHWLKLARIINEMSKDPDINGFVITHGTNTLDETAYFLNLTVKTIKPVVMVGSMRSASSLSADGPLNLYQAVALSASPLALGRGVMIVFAEAIYSARDVTKQSTYSSDAFGNRNMSCLGYIKGNVPSFNYSILKPHTVDSEFEIEKIDKLPKVEILYMYTECDIGLLEYSLANYSGLVIAGAGNGCYTELWQEKLEEHAYKNFPVVRSSRVGSGIVTHEPYYDKAQNVIMGDNLSPQKARILLQLALSKTSDIDEIKRMFRKY